ncbi:hypothetical protein ACJX0J_022001, partial [Zea mays]
AFLSQYEPQEAEGNYNKQMHEIDNAPQTLFFITILIPLVVLYSNTLLLQARDQLFLLFFFLIAGSCALSKVSLFDDPNEEEESFGQVKLNNKDLKLYLSIIYMITLTSTWCTPHVVFFLFMH